VTPREHAEQLQGWVPAGEEDRVHLDALVQLAEDYLSLREKIAAARTYAGMALDIELAPDLVLSQLMRDLGKAVDR
jgi:hypothetical protein